MTAVADDRASTGPITDLVAIVTHVKNGSVSEINQRNNIQMVIILNDGQRLLYFRPPNTYMNRLLMDAGVTNTQLDTIRFTAGTPYATLRMLGVLLQITGLAGLAFVVIFGYYVRRLQMMSDRR